MLRQGLAPITANDRLKKLRAFFRFAIESGWIEQNPSLSLKPAKVMPNPTLPLDEREMARILAACDRGAA
jgi:site-specific recombinase XerD